MSKNNLKKIGHISYCYQPVVGGQEVYIANMLKMLDEQGIVSTVYQPINKQYHYFSKSKDPKVKLVFNIPFLGRFIPKIGQYLFSLLLLTRILSLLKEDIIIVHYAFYALPLWFINKKVIVLSHGVEWNIESTSLDDRIHLWIAKKTFNRFTIVANDTHYFRTLGLDVEPKKNCFQEVAPNKWFIPNCVDSQKFNKVEPLAEFHNKKIILVPRQITVDRGIHLAIEAFHLFNNEVPGYTLLIIGTIRGLDYKEYCDELINKYSLDEQVIWRHDITNNEIVKYYSTARLTLIPTLRREGTSLSALESMACGCPTITTNVAGLRDLPSIQVETLPESIKNNLIKLLKNTEFIAKQQQQNVRENYNIGLWFKGWQRVIEQIHEIN